MASRPSRMRSILCVLSVPLRPQRLKSFRQVCWFLNRSSIELAEAVDVESAETRREKMPRQENDQIPMTKSQTWRCPDKGPNSRFEIRSTNRGSKHEASSTKHQTNSNTEISMSQIPGLEFCGLCHWNLFVI